MLYMINLHMPLLLVKPVSSTYAGVIRGSRHEKLYQELGLEFLHHRRQMRRWWLLYKVFSNKGPKYNYELISRIRPSCRNPNSFAAFTCRTAYFKNSQFLCVINDWKKNDPEIRNSTSYLSFRNALINFNSLQRKKSSIFMTRSVLN